MSSKLVLTSTATISVRGTITSRTLVNSSSMTPRIICAFVVMKRGAGLLHLDEEDELLGAAGDGGLPALPGAQDGAHRGVEDKDRQAEGDADEVDDGAEGFLGASRVLRDKCPREGLQKEESGGDGESRDRQGEPAIVPFTQDKKDDDGGDADKSEVAGEREGGEGELALVVEAAEGLDAGLGGFAESALADAGDDAGLRGDDEDEGEDARLPGRAAPGKCRYPRCLRTCFEGGFWLLRGFFAFRRTEARSLGVSVRGGASGGDTGDFGAVRHVFGDDGAGAGGGLAADADGRDEHGVAANEGAVFDDGLVLVLAVVVAGDGTGADVHVRADFGVADVAEVAGTAAGADAGGLDLDEVADVDARLEVSAGTKMAEGADVRPALDYGAFDDGDVDGHLVLDSAVDDDRVGADAAAGADRRLADERGVRVDDRAQADFDAGVNVGGFEVHDRGPRRLCDFADVRGRRFLVRVRAAFLSLAHAQTGR